MREVVIVSAARTAIGKFGGSLKGVPTRKLGAVCIEEALKRAGLEKDQVDEVIMGCVLQGGLGQNVARQMMLDAGLPVEVPCFTINKVCGSGLRAVELAAQIIKAGDADIIVAGGAENMSATAYAMKDARWGARMFDAKMTDMMVNDGLWDAFNNYHMGVTAENVAEQWGLTREELDEFSVISQNRAEKAIDAGVFKDEIVPVEIPQRIKALKKLETKVWNDDQTQLFIETPYRNAKMFETIVGALKPNTKLCVAAGITCAEEYIKTKTVAQWKKEKLPDLGKIPAIFLIGK